MLEVMLEVLICEISLLLLLSEYVFELQQPNTSKKKKKQKKQGKCAQNINQCGRCFILYFYFRRMILAKLTVG